jgi:hypothetical protein
MLWTCWLWIAAAGATPLLDLDFSVDDGGMANSNGLQWRWGEIGTGPTGFTGPAWATQPDGDYLNDVVDALGLPFVDLSATERPVLVVDHWYEIDESGVGDLGWVSVKVDGEQVHLSPIHGYPSDQGFSGTSLGFRTDYFDLSGIDTTDDIKLVFEADAAVARAGWVISSLRIEDGDPVPPEITGVTELGDTQNLSGPYVVHAEITDDLTAPGVTLHWRLGTGGQTSEDMAHVGADLYRGEIPGMDPGSRVRWWISATDGLNNATWPEDGKASFDVFLAAPTGLVAPDARSDGRLTGLDVALEWEAPSSPHPLVHTVIFRDDQRIDEVLGTSAVVPLTLPAHHFTVAGVFNTPEGQLQGDLAAGLDFTIALPAATALQPAYGFQGDALRIGIRGVNLLLTEDQIALQLGDGVVVTVLEVVDADTAIATISIAEDAPIQATDAFLLTGATRVTLPGGFEVRDGSDRPQLIDVTPASIKQGGAATLTIQSNAPIGAGPIIDLGPGIFVQSTEVDGDTLRVGIATAIDSPIGAHQIIVDDGLRILSGASIEVRDAKPPPGKVCASTPGQPTGVWALVLAACLGLGRRKNY